ncbi:two-component system sensor histidine kinase NtrB [Anaeroselena agilis]|uniref:histidine kinase n=1 Tax=Anaeroselena agilis TaxID=3063788 RepID=A0ABU3NX83_9FIRM|nr:ATP-binding protein [Selenomonadales bacterium 4137-cl]
MVIFISVPFALLAFQHAQYAKQHLLNEKQKTLLTIATILEQRFPGSFRIPGNESRGLTVDARRHILYEKLQPTLREVAIDWPGYGFGYYDRDLHIVALIPENPRLLGAKATDEALRVYKSRHTETVYIGNSFMQDSDAILSVNYPLYHRGEIIGHIWVNVKGHDIRAAYYAELGKTLGVLVIILLIILAGVWWLSWNNNYSLTMLAEHIKQGGEEEEYFREFPQIKPLLDTVTDLRNRLSNEYAAQARVEAEIARFDRLNLIGEMATGVVHEIRNPMTVIRGYVQRMMLKADQSQTAQYAVIIEEIDHMNETMTAFLSLAKNRRVEIGLHNINGIIENIMPLIEADANKAGVHVDFRPAEQPLMVYADDKEIRQLVLNLARNAIEATPSRGAMSVRTALNEKAVCLTVTDTGEGIAPWNLEKIFDPFFTTKDAGTGLGLAICKSIIDRHHGRIDVQSQRGRGTVFTVELPVVA